MKKFNQLCVWPGILPPDGTTEECAEQFEKFIKKNFNCRAKFAEQIFTLPDIKNGNPVPNTGGRSDLFFYIHDDDISKFAVPRLHVGIRWWEDVLSNGGRNLYTKEILKKYPKKW